MTVKELKELLNKVDDDFDVVIVNGLGSDDYPIMNVISAGVLECKFEDHNALGFMCSVHQRIDDATSYTTEVLYDKNPNPEGYDKLPGVGEW